MAYEDVVALDPHAVRCPYPAYEQLRADGVRRVEPANAYVVSRAADLVAVCADTETFSSRNAIGAPPFPPESEVAKYVPVLLLSDEPRHTEVRKVVQRAFTPSRIARFEEPIRDLCNRLIDAVRGQDVVDAMAAYAVPLPIRIILIILGVPDDNLEDFRRLSEELAAKVGHEDADPADQLRIAKEFVGHVAPLIDSAGLEEDEGTILATIAREVRAGTLDRHDGARLVLELILAGNVTTTDHIGNSLRLLADRPDVADQIRADWSLLPTFIEESLRLESPIQGLFRLATRDAEAGGTTIPEGSRLQVMFGSANRDPEAFERPDELDLTRRGAGKHLAFGSGTHTCLGNMVARLEGRVAVEAFLCATTTFELAVDADAVPYLPSFVNRGPLDLPLRVTWA